MAKDYRNQELHDPLRVGSLDLETQYKSKAREDISRQLSEAQGQVNAAKGQLATAQGTVDGYNAEVAQAEGMLTGIKGQRQNEWDSIHEKYKARSDKMKEILENIMVGGQKDA
jgi:chromosome segregation ATPase